MNTNFMPAFRLTKDTLPALCHNPLVSVIIVNYNYADYIAEAIDSVLAQTYKNFELIIVDDGSLDNSRNVIESYEGCGQKIITIFKENGGQASGFNTGFEHSDGEIVCFLDSDDRFAERKLEEVVKGFQSNPDWVQLSNLCMSMDTGGNPIDRNSNRSLTEGDARPLLVRFGKYGSIRTSAISFRRQVLAEILPAPLWKVSSDAYLMCTAPFYGEIGKLERILTHYRFHDSNAHSGSKNIEYHIYHRQQIVDSINSTTKKLNLGWHYDINNDADYVTWKMIHDKSSSLLTYIHVIRLVIFESYHIRRTIKELFIRLAWITMCALNPNEGEIILKNGLKRYAQTKMLRKTIAE